MRWLPKRRQKKAERATGLDIVYGEGQTKPNPPLEFPREDAVEVKLRWTEDDGTPIEGVSFEHMKNIVNNNAVKPVIEQCKALNLQYPDRKWRVIVGNDSAWAEEMP